VLFNSLIAGIFSPQPQSVTSIPEYDWLCEISSYVSYNQEWIRNVATWSVSALARVIFPEKKPRRCFCQQLGTRRG